MIQGLACFDKERNFLRVQRLGLPLPLILGEHAQCIGTELVGRDEGVLKSSSDAGMRSNRMHRGNLEL